jgi:hypothetical protein
MTSHYAADAVVAIPMFLALLAFWWGPWRWAVTDLARYHMFVVRDELFDAASSGIFTFSDRRYVEIRESINASIRFAHAMSLSMLLWHVVSRRIEGRKGAINKGRIVASQFHDTEAREIAHRALDKIEFVTWALVFAKSPLLATVVGIFVLFPHFRHSIRGRLKARLRPYTDLLQSEAAAA